MPVYREVFADHDTPVSAFRKIDDGPYGFSSRASRGGEKWGAIRCSAAARRSCSPRARRDLRDPSRRQDDQGHEASARRARRELLREHQAVALPGCRASAAAPWATSRTTPCAGSRSCASQAKDELEVPDAIFLFGDVVSVFDNLTHTMKVVTHARGETTERRVRRGRRAAERRGRAPAQAAVVDRAAGVGRGERARLERLEGEVHGGRRDRQGTHPRGRHLPGRAQHRMSADVSQPAFEGYRALRVTNPSPYMYFLRVGDFSIVGSSPEVLVRRTDTTIEVRPIAGTRPRGRNTDEDRALGEELLGEREGARRARDARGPRPQRRRPRRRVRLGRDERVPHGRALLAGHAPRVERARTREGRAHPDRRRARDVPGRHCLGRAPRCARWRSSSRSNPCAAASTRAPSGTSTITATSTSRDRHPHARVFERPGVLGRGRRHRGGLQPEHEWDETMNKGRALWLAVQRAEQGAR